MPLCLWVCGYPEVQVCMPWSLDVHFLVLGCTCSGVWVCTSFGMSAHILQCACACTGMAVLFFKLLICNLQVQTKCVHAGHHTQRMISRACAQHDAYCNVGYCPLSACSHVHARAHTQNDIHSYTNAHIHLSCGVHLKPHRTMQNASSHSGARTTYTPRCVAYSPYSTRFIFALCYGFVHHIL
jgi:hypothetical protein